MRRFSRHMAPSPEPGGGALWGVLLVFAGGGLLLLAIRAPILLVGVAALAIWMRRESRAEAARLRLMATLRRSDSICTFARSFDRREMDPWVVRAVYDELQQYSGFPVRARDEIEDDLRIDEEDLEYLVRDTARRAGRSMDHAAANPLCGRVQRVSDVVRFLMHQPSVLPSGTSPR